MKMTRQLNALALIVALALVAAISSYLTSLNDTDRPDARPLPALADGLSSTAAIAGQQFADRVRQRFPIGSPEQALLFELWYEGFEHPGEGEGHARWASLERHGIPCRRDWTVTWTANEGGRLTAVAGTYIPSCL